MKKRILFVDDERQIRKAIKRLFINSEYELLFAESGQEALEILKSEDVDMIISDMLMPGMTGEKLLEKIIKFKPHIIRVALSGYTEKGVVLSVLDKNLAKIYLFKPWDNNEFINTINGLFEFELMLENDNLVSIINDIDNLPTLPSLYTKISEMISDEKSISKIAECIENDPSIAARVLKISNSAYYGKKTSDVHRAIMFIGLSNIKNIILSTSIYGANSKNIKMVKEEFEHSSLTNRIIDLIYLEILHKPTPSEARSAGLLHNIGKSVFLMEFEADFYKNINIKEALEKEEKFLGVDHQVLGSYLLNWWELPLSIVETAFFHHNPLDEKIVNKELLYIVHIAQYYASKIMKKEKDDILYVDSFAKLKISRSEFEGLLKTSGL